jgi:apolipoprotein N-acyltransferase
MIFSKKYRFFLSIISGLLLILSFPFTGGLAFLGFVAWVPLLLVENSIRTGKLRSGKVFVHAYLSFLIYNLGTTFWIYFASPEGAYMAFILNSLLMSLAFYAYHIARKQLSAKWGWVFLIVFWVGFEHAHYHWELSWPWLTLGNVFSLYPQVVQWYEITGVMGGSVWLLGVNYLIFSYLLNQFQLPKGEIQTNGKRLLIGIFTALFLPSTFSLVRFFTYQEAINPVEVAVIQPNIDPYNEKFVRDPSEQINKMLGLASEISSDKTNFILFPETAISSSVEEGYLRQSESASAFLTFAKDHPKVHLLTGASTYAFFKQKNSIASKKINGSSDFIEFYNFIKEGESRK